MRQLVAHPAAALAALLVAVACGRQTRTAGTTTETVRIASVGKQPSMSIPTVSPTVPRTARIPAPIDRVWSVLPAVFDSLGIPVDRVDHQRRIIGTEGHRVRRRLGGVSLTRYLDCGSAQGAPSAESYEIHLVLLTELQGSASETTAATVMKATARPVNFAGEHSPCSTTGELEARIGRLITELL